MMLWGVMFTHVISRVTVSWAPVDKKLVLSDTVADPIKPHIDSFSSFQFYAGVSKANCGCVVDLDRGRGLGVTHLDEGDAKWEGFLSGEEGGANFYLSGGAHHVLE